MTRYTTKKGGVKMYQAQKKRKSYLIELQLTKTKLVRVYDYTADRAKERALKAAKRGVVSMENTKEIYYNAVSKSEDNLAVKDRKVIDLPYDYNFKEWSGTGVTECSQKTQKMPRIYKVNH